MTTQQLETFIQVAENLNFARAAEFLNVTTSAVSRQIRSLEEELDTKLLRRSTRAVTLTPAGILFLSDAKEILAKLKMTSEKLKNQAETNIQLLTIGCVNDADLFLLAEVLKQAKEQMPGLHPLLRIVPTRLILNMFLHDELEVLFSFQDDIPMRDGFFYHELAQIPICFVMPSDHPLASREEISDADLLSENLIVCNSYEIPPQIASLQNQLRSRTPLNATHYCENTQALRTLVKAGYGIGILPEMPSESDSLAYVPFAGDCSLSYGVFYKDTSKNPCLKKFLSLMDIK